MAQLKSTVVQGSLRVTDTTYTNDLVVSDTTAPTIANNDYLLVADASDGNKLLKGPVFDGSTTSQALTKKGTWATFNNYSHPTGDGNLHVPATGTGNNGKVLKAGSTAGSLSWGTLGKSDVGLGNVANSTYAGGTAVTLNGTSKAASTASFYAPTAAGTSGQYLKSTGGVPEWANFSSSTVGLGNVSNNANLNSTTGAKGDIIYWSAANTPAHLTNTSSTTKHFLSITSQAPAWTTLAKGDVGLGNVTNDKQLPIAGGTMTGRLTAAKGFNNLLTGTGTAGANNSGTYTPVKWTFNAGVTVADGDRFTVKIPNITNADWGVFMSVDNGTSYHPVGLLPNGRLTTHYAVGCYIDVVFEASGRVDSVFPLAGGTARTNITSGGVWRVINYYDSNSDWGYYQRMIYPNLKAGTGSIHPNSIIMQLANGRWASITTTAPNNPGASNVSPKATGKAANTNEFRLSPIYVMLANTTYADGANIGTYNVYAYHSGLIDARYSFNLENNSTNGFTAYSPVYIVGTISNGLFKLDTTKWWTCTLPSSDDGKVYIHIGDAYDWYRITLQEHKPIYWYKDGHVRPYSPATKATVGLGSVENTALSTWAGTNKITTVGTISTGTWQGTKIDASYLPTASTTAAGIIQIGTGALNAAAGNHAHGNIQNGGTLQTNDITIGADDKLVVTDSSDGNKIARTSLSFDGSTTRQVLTKKGTWEIVQSVIAIDVAATTATATSISNPLITVNHIALNDVVADAKSDITVKTALGSVQILCDDGIPAFKLILALPL